MDIGGWPSLSALVDSTNQVWCGSTSKADDTTRIVGLEVDLLLVLNLNLYFRVPRSSLVLGRKVFPS